MKWKLPEKSRRTTVSEDQGFHGSILSLERGTLTSGATCAGVQVAITIRGAGGRGRRIANRGAGTIGVPMS